MEPNPNRAEAERLLAVAEKLLEARDLSGAREFAALAQETDPLIDGSDQILAVADVLLASEGARPDWYSLLQIGPRSDDPDLIRTHYRRLAILLHPDRNSLPYADQAFRLVGEAWSVLSDPARKPAYDRELSIYSKVDLPDTGGGPTAAAGKKLPVKRGRPRSAAAADRGEKPSPMMSSFWTGCPYCCRLYEYPRLYEDCCLRCQHCQKAFHAVVVSSLPPLIPGRKDAYYCPWGGFPFGAVPAAGSAPEVFPAWTNQAPPPPPMPPFPGYGPPPGSQPPAPAPHPPPAVMVRPVAGNVGSGDRAGEVAKESMAPRKRGRPRKNPVIT